MVGISAGAKVYKLSLEIKEPTWLSLRKILKPQKKNRNRDIVSYRLKKKKIKSKAGDYYSYLS